MARQEIFHKIPIIRGEKRMGKSSTFRVTTDNIDRKIENVQVVRKITFFRKKPDGRIQQKTSVGVSHNYPIDADNIIKAREEAINNAIAGISFSFDGFKIIDEAFMQYKRVPKELERQEFIERFR